MSGKRILLYSLGWSIGTISWGVAMHHDPQEIFRSVWDVTGFALIAAFLIWMDARA
jgi:hypothetical protein